MRQRVVHWGPRTLDVDLLFFDDVSIDERGVDGARIRASPSADSCSPRSPRSLPSGAR